MPKLTVKERTRKALAAPGARPARAPLVAQRPAVAPVIQRAEACACGGGCPRCEGAAKSANGLAPAAAELVARADGSSGAPLPDDLRANFGAGLGADLSGVRVHTGAESDDAARAVGARAYTAGQRIHFAAGQYDPASGEGRRLLAHEVVHTLQQGGDGARTHGARPEVSQPGDASEREADSLAGALVGSGVASGATGGAGGAPRVRTTPHLARQPADPQGATGTTDLTPAATTATTTTATGTATGTPAAAPAPKAEPWEELFPHVHAKDKEKRRQHDRGITKIVNEKNKEPEMQYVEGAYEVEQLPGEEEPLLKKKKKSSEPAQEPAEPSRTDDDPVWQAMEARYDEWLAARKAKRDKAVSEVLAARNAIPARDIGRDPWQKIGNFYDPVLAAKKEDPNDPYSSGDEQAASYNAWLGGAKPTTKFDETNGSDKTKWAIFQKMIPLEGRVGTVTTFDKTLTIGVGFSSAGTQAEQVIARLFDAVPSVREAAYAAGLSVKGKDSLVVLDAERRYILEGFAAANYVQTQPALLSLLVNASQGVQPDAAGKKPDAAGVVGQRQAMLNAQWETFLDNALKGIPAALLAWPLDSVALAVHARHAIQSTFPWSFWEGQGSTAVRDLVRALYLRLRATKQLGWLFPICGGMYKPHAEAVKAEQEAKAKETK